MRSVFVLILCSLLITSSIYVNSETTPHVSASSAIVMDMNTKEVLFEKNAHEKRNIASITKIMTAIVALEHGNLEDQVIISYDASRKIGSSIYTREGQKYSLKDLLYGLMLRSGNDAAAAIAEHIAGSEKGFAFLMNEKARWIGMENSSFQNPHGLDEDGHYSTAYDMALLTTYAMKSNEDFRKIFGTKKYLSENVNYYWFNKNKLLMTNDYCIGGKTGYTKSAGRTLVTTAELDGKEIVVVTLNAHSDWNDHRNLYKYAFEKLETEKQENDDSTDFFNFPSFIDSYIDVFNRLNGVKKWSI
ncbi:D-alanyl-D-alanine carboxypeptidase family protein [Bacillaceae bacterium W0354]